MPPIHQGFISYKHSRICYSRYGEGPKTAICFHGFGEDGSRFSFFGEHATSYSFYCIDLPFHGQTEWNEGLEFTPADLAAIIEQLLPDLLSRFTLIGFSLGSRMALCTLELFPSRIEKMLLMAPDGLKVNFWYWLATQTTLGNGLFHYSMHHPGWFINLLKLAHKTGLANASIYKFVTHSVGEKEVRLQLYQRWTALRKIKPDLNVVKKLIIQHEIPTRLIYGKHDRIMPATVGERFRKGIEQHCTLSIIASGHQVLHAKHADEILPSLYN